MKKFLFLTLVSIIFIIPLSSYAAVSNEHYEETNIIVESEILTQAKIVEASSIARSPDPNRIYYTADGRATVYTEAGGDRTPIYSIVNRYVWSVSADNPTLDTISADSVTVVDQIIYPTGSVFLVHDPRIDFGRVHPLGYWYSNVTVDILASTGVITFMQDAHLYPDGSVNFVEHAFNTAARSPSACIASNAC